jgi:hypothetical protein
MILIASLMLVVFSLFLGCAKEKKPDYTLEINEKGIIAAEADAKFAANKFDEAIVTYQKALSELAALKQKIPAGDPSLAPLETMVSGIKDKLEKVASAKQEFEAKASAEAKKKEAKPEVKPKAKPAVKTVQELNAQPKTKIETTSEVKVEAQTKKEAVVVEPAKKAPVKWKVVYRGTMKTGETEWHILCGESLARIIRQDTKKTEKAYQGGFGGQWFDKMDEAAVAACSK